MSLDPQVAAFYGNKLKKAPPHPPSAEHARLVADAGFNDRESWRLPVFRVADQEIPSGYCRHLQQSMTLPFFSVKSQSAGNGDETIPIRIYTPSDPENEKKPLPVMLYFHGGGFVMHNIASHDLLCRKLALACGCIVVSAGYRLAPEYPYPACMEDGFDALVWVWENAPLLGGSPEQIVLAGDSAGATISAVLSLMIRDLSPAAALPQIGLQVLCYGAAGCIPDDESQSVKEFGQGGFVLPRTLLDWCMEQYVPPDADPFDSYLNPGRAADLRNLPPTLCITAECDPLRDDGEAFARRLSEDGNQVILYRAPGMMHGFLLYWHKFDRATEVIERIANQVQAAFR